MVAAGADWGDAVAAGATVEDGTGTGVAVATGVGVAGALVGVIEATVADGVEG